MRNLVLWLRTPRGRAIGLVAAVVLSVLTVVTGLLATPQTAGTEDPGVVGVELAGTAATGGWMVAAYGADEITGSLGWDLLFILCWSALLALLALWSGQGYRTVSTRRLAFPLALSALGAGLMDLVEDLCLWLAVERGNDGAWPLAAAAAWGKFLVVGLVGLYVVGGLLSLLLRPDVRRVLRQADEEAGMPPSRTMREGRTGLAFSGGGVRAASITLGALQALERDGAMGWEAADDVTSVSGGSYMAGAWSLARSEPAPETPSSVPKPWAAGGIQPGPEERHLRANLGYLLSNSPRGSGDDSLAPSGEDSSTARAQRLPAVVATVVTGMLVNALVFLGMLWVLAQLLGWFYRWYFGLSCATWRAGGTLTFDADHACMAEPDRLTTPIVIWLGVGLGVVLAWVLAAKASEVIGRADPPAWLLALKYLGYGGLALAAALALVLGALPWMIGALWQPISTNQVLTDLVAVAGAVGSAGAVLRLLRKPLAKVAPWLGGVLFALVLLFLLCRWALGAMAADPDARTLVPLALALVALLIVHFGGAPEFWSLGAFYRGKLRSAFATYRLTGPTGVRARAYVNNDRPLEGERIEPSLSQIPARDPATGSGTPLTICASATIVGRQVRTHYGIPALSVTFSPSHVRLFAPLEENGLWQQYSCTTADMDRLRPSLRPRLTTMMAVGVSGAAVSPAMGRFRIGPISMLLAFFNVRLGAWIPNPRYAAELAAAGRPLPRPGLGYLLKEFFGFLDPSDLYLYVTDGGHWENTALVELLRTAYHREIVCVDADSGPGNLARSISKAIDLAQLECAATVAINLDVLRADRDPSPGRDYSPRSVNLGLVRRVDGNGERVSVLWYSKPALTQDMPPQLLAYREVDPTFPRVSTVNQFFHVAQFAAYRDLGRFNAQKVLAARATLAAEVARHETYVGFRAAVEDGPEGPLADLAELVSTFTGQETRQEPAEPWVVPELVALIEHLCLDRVPVERAAYGEELYATVRETLLPQPGRHVAPRSGAAPTSGAS
ncbi:patatin-like phospholipase family protein [Nocardioides guangzhouensis]|uniref:Patatin-like phospholipase family protein n=1 Tax=Nocardioides guangzhouensis TaxID=2497878 RepID=A0A4Q4ZHC5_9ACTN|nr:patatin-like phospholipase family protein [Nocardioides guangzhouensis]RYP86891.1 patatin-like phospholipase family protein [Nocardioides guangzhouensis]